MNNWEHADEYLLAINTRKFRTLSIFNEYPSLSRPHFEADKNSIRWPDLLAPCATHNHHLRGKLFTEHPVRSFAVLDHPRDSARETL